MFALNGETVSDADSPMEQGYVTLDHDTDVLTVEFPSGGGMFDPLDRDPERAATDRKNGIVTQVKSDWVDRLINGPSDQSWIE